MAGTWLLLIVCVCEVFPSEQEDNFKNYIQLHKTTKVSGIFRDQDNV